MASIPPRPFLPIQPCPTIAHFPPLPSPPRQTIHAAYTLTTHLVPAAFPRSIPDIPLPEIPPHSAPNRQAQITLLTKELVETRARFAQGELRGGHSQKPLWNCVNRQVRTDKRHVTRPGLTLFLAHANGFPKEIWETMLRRLFDSPAALLVDEVWSWEAVNHGDAALVNASNLSGIFDWQDNARDIANFLLNYLPDDATDALLPTHLDLVPKATSDARAERGYTRRTLVVVGHSFGGTSSTLAALNYPRLFSSLILVDPIIGFSGVFITDRAEHVSKLVSGTLVRRDTWPSREEALRLFKQSPFFASWHPEVLELYAKYGLTADTGNGVRLKTLPIHESLTFAETHVPDEVGVLLEQLDGNIVLRWIVPELGSLAANQSQTWVRRRPGNTSNVVFPLAGHLFVQESPAELAHDIAKFLLDEYGLQTKASL